MSNDQSKNEKTYAVNDNSSNESIETIVQAELRDPSDLPLEIRTLVVTSSGIRDVYEWADRNYTKKCTGISALEATLIASNWMLLRDVNAEISKNVQTIENSDYYKEYQEKLKEITDKYADRDYLGQIIYQEDESSSLQEEAAPISYGIGSNPSKTPVFKENYIEYKEAMKQLAKEPCSTTLLEKKIEQSTKTYAVRMCCLRDLSQTLVTASPAVIGILVGGVLLDLRLKDKREGVN